jgi:radical SAM superfamily enzyme YgiQ (UPF0313 family)
MARPILLIYPYTGEMDAIRSRPHLPLSLIQAASLAAQEFDVHIVDLRIAKDSRSAIAQAIEKDPMFVGLSVMSGRPVAHAYEASAYIKKNWDVPIVWGGHHPTLDQENTLKDPAVDMIVIGDGEKTLLDLARNMAKGTGAKGIAGLWYKDADGNVVKNGPRPPVALDDLPSPPYRLVNIEDYVQTYRGRDMINIETSRGCVYGCRYCYHSACNSFHRFRSLNPENTLKRMQWARDVFGVDGVYLVDDNFFIDFDRGMTVVRALSGLKEKIYYQIQGVDVPSMLKFSEEELRLLEDSGLLRISVGAESGSEKVLKYVKKPHTVEMLVEANRRFARHSINIFYSFVSGFPTETADDVKATLRMMMQLIDENPHARTSPLYNFLPFPGSAMWDEVIGGHGYAPPKELSDWKAYDWNHVNVGYLDADLKKLLNNVYWPSLFLDKKFDDYDMPFLFNMATRLYRPIGRYRVKKACFAFPIERHAAKLAERFFSSIQKKKETNQWTM